MTNLLSLPIPRQVIHSLELIRRSRSLSHPIVNFLAQARRFLIFFIIRRKFFTSLRSKYLLPLVSNCMNFQSAALLSNVSTMGSGVVVLAVDTSVMSGENNLIQALFRLSGCVSAKWLPFTAVKSVQRHQEERLIDYWVI